MYTYTCIHTYYICIYINIHIIQPCSYWRPVGPLIIPRKRLAIDTNVFVISTYCLPMTYHVSFPPPPRSFFSTLAVFSLSFTHCSFPLPPASSTQEKELGYGVPWGAKQSFPPLSTTHHASPPPQPTSTRRCFLHTSGLEGGGGQSLAFLKYFFHFLPFSMPSQICHTDTKK